MQIARTGMELEQQQDTKIENTPEWHQEDAGPVTQTKSHSSSNHSGYFEKDQTGMVPKSSRGRHYNAMGCQCTVFLGSAWMS